MSLIGDKLDDPLSEDEMRIWLTDKEFHQMWKGDLVGNYNQLNKAREIFQLTNQINNDKREYNRISALIEEQIVERFMKSDDVDVVNKQSSGRHIVNPYVIEPNIIKALSKLTELIETNEQKIQIIKDEHNNIRRRDRWKDTY